MQAGELIEAPNTKGLKFDLLANIIDREATGVSSFGDVHIRRCMTVSLFSAGTHKGQLKVCGCRPTPRLTFSVGERSFRLSPDSTMLRKPSLERTTQPGPGNLASAIPSRTGARLFRTVSSPGHPRVASRFVPSYGRSVSIMTGNCGCWILAQQFLEWTGEKTRCLTQGGSPRGVRETKVNWGGHCPHQGYP